VYGKWQQMRGAADPNVAVPAQGGRDGRLASQPPSGCQEAPGVALADTLPGRGKPHAGYASGWGFLAVACHPISNLSETPGTPLATTERRHAGCPLLPCASKNQQIGGRRRQS